MMFIKINLATRQNYPFIISNCCRKLHHKKTMVWIEHRRHMFTAHLTQDPIKEHWKHSWINQSGWSALRNKTSTSLLPPLPLENMGKLKMIIILLHSIKLPIHKGTITAQTATRSIAEWSLIEKSLSSTEW